MKLRSSILKVLVYFDLFNYPVSEEEIQFFMDQKACRVDIYNTLLQLVNEGYVFYCGKFFSLQDAPALAERRMKGNDHAKSLLAVANKVSGFLFRFPYVRGVSISGSLSKNFADQDADIDLFIITKSNRLWIARTIMHLFKKLTFLVGRQHWFCMNYYIDENALQIDEKNIFTAMELLTLLPICGNGAIDNFFNANDWAKGYYPNCVVRTVDPKNKKDRSWLKKVIERLFDNKLGDRLDNYLMKLTTRRWQKKEKEHKLNIKGGRMGMRTGKHFAKPNPGFFQKRILEMYQRKLQETEARWKEPVEQ